MAVIKAVSSKAGINTVLDYVMQEEKTEQKLLSGLNCVPDTVKDEMRVTKLLWDKDGGRTYKHFVQSFAPGEKINPAHDSLGPRPAGRRGAGPCRPCGRRKELGGGHPSYRPGLRGPDGDAGRTRGTNWERNDPCSGLCEKNTS